MTQSPVSDILSLASLSMGPRQDAYLLANLTIQTALDIARNSDGEVDSVVWTYLEDQVDELWSRIRTHPESYVMDKDEFALFNYFIRRYAESSLAEKAVARFWQCHHRQDSASG
ncbi:hypothetical protein CAC42_6571 [Sphaceloma murrayae]|uniref:Uncharacterized protein n=1 Tax=Sphaceloma murrayae TaxID=2082308 RepID=A0A2K1QFU0_9PEZI|nr:hypothetical protein CAC42_6571 [Sphaceloma murrayae]